FFPPDLEAVKCSPDMRSATRVPSRAADWRGSHYHVREQFGGKRRLVGSMSPGIVDIAAEGRTSTLHAGDESNPQLPARFAVQSESHCRRHRSAHDEHGTVGIAHAAKPPVLWDVCMTAREPPTGFARSMVASQSSTAKIEFQRGDTPQS